MASSFQDWVNEKQGDLMFRPAGKQKARTKKVQNNDFIWISNQESQYHTGSAGREVTPADTEGTPDENGRRGDVSAGTADSETAEGDVNNGI